MHTVVLHWTETAFPLQSVFFSCHLAAALKMAVTECLIVLLCRPHSEQRRQRKYKESADKICMSLEMPGESVDSFTEIMTL